MEMMYEYDIDPSEVILYTSPFRRCIETSIGILQGMPHKPLIRIEVGLGEWMCERFFDSVCDAKQLVSHGHQRLAREQASAYAKQQVPLKVDYTYKGCRSEFNFPESYTDMVHRFEETRQSCLKDETRLVLFVTHAVGVNALLDGFRNHLTRPLKSNYCSLSLVSKQKDQESEYPDTAWSIEMTMSDSHLLI